MPEIMISICCATYNHEKYIKEALDGFLMQKTQFLFEIIIHDDASTDATAKIIREYEKEYPNIIKPIYQKENQHSKGKSIFKTYFYPRARGKYIALCEGDDCWIDPYKLQKQVEYMERHPECSLTFHAANYITDGKIIMNDKHFAQECDISAEQIILGGGEYCATASLCFRSEYVRNIPDYMRVAQVGDYPLQVHLATKGTVHYFPDIMSNYRYGHIGSWTAETFAKEAASIKHWKNEVLWMRGLNQETQGYYRQSVDVVIARDVVKIYSYGAISGKRVRYFISKVHFGKNKILLYRGYFFQVLKHRHPKIAEFIKSIVMSTKRKS